MFGKLIILTANWRAYLKDVFLPIEYCFKKCKSATHSSLVQQFILG